MKQGKRGTKGLAWMLIALAVMSAGCSISAEASNREEKDMIENQSSAGTEASVVELEGFQVVGVSLTATLNEIAAKGLGKKALAELKERAAEIEGKAGDEVYMIQLYAPGFNGEDSPLTQIIGYRVNAAAAVPDGMVKHDVPGQSYAAYTHRGLESELGRSYDYLYGVYLPEVNKSASGFDFEVWDERYKPESPDNEIEMYVAVR